MENQLVSGKGVQAQPAPNFFQIAVFSTTETLIRWTFYNTAWEFGNRQAYDTAWWYFVDSGSAVYSGNRAIRLILQVYGEGYKINDRNGVQNETSTRLMPEEPVFPAPDLSHEVAGLISFVRRDPSNPKVPTAIGGFAPKADDLQDPDVHWYYQGAGVLVATYDGNIILRLTLQSARDDVMFLSPLG